LDFVAATYASARKALVLYVLFGLILLALLGVLPGPTAVVVAFAVVALLGAIFAVIFVTVRRRAMT
jgi:fucose permease